jgi:hypothetical protein
MSKILKYTFLAIFLFYGIISHFESAFYWAADHKIYPDNFRYGDLYRLSFLPQFKQKAINCADSEAPKVANNVHLYIIGDSFGEDSKIDTGLFKADKYQFAHWDYPKDIVLDPKATNVLVMESVERSAKLHFIKPSNEFTIANKPASSTITKNSNSFAFFQNILDQFSKNTKNTEERILQTAFNYDFTLFFRELKASLDLNLFDRKSPNFNLSRDKTSLFYFEEAAENCPNSSFYPVTNSEVDAFVKIINANSEHYKRLGFDKVLLSIIPNKVSILDPELGNYNDVLQRIQNNKNLKVNFVNLYPIFKNSKDELYLKSDSHWNCTGSAIWQNLVNEKLATINISK